MFTPLDERANGRGRGVKNVYAVALDDAPEPIRLRMIGRAFVHQHRRAVRKRSVNDIAVPGYPANVSSAPVEVLIFDIENPFGRKVGLQQISGGGVKDAFRFSVCLGVKDKVGCSLSSSAAGHSASTVSISSCHQKSRPASMWIGTPVRRTTIQDVTEGVCLSASSTAIFNFTSLPRRHPPSAVTTTVQLASLIRSISAELEKPPKMTE